MQTPQAFAADALRAAQRPRADVTDDAALVEAIGGSVVVVPGDPRNLDHRPCRSHHRGGVARGLSTFRVGMGYDIHPFVTAADDERALVLGGVVLDGPGLAGHSDADAVCHVVADALLGPAGLPDLGSLFPASDDRYRGASSVELLRDVVGRVAEAGWSVGNVDVVIAAERPRLAPHLAAMARNLTEALGGAFVSVTPKRGEGIGTVGRGEGIACWAVALVERPGVVRRRAAEGARTTLGAPWSASVTPSCATPSS